LEQIVAEANGLNGNTDLSGEISIACPEKKRCYPKYLERRPVYFDFDFVRGKQKEGMSLAGAFPLFFRIASDKQAERVAARIREDFLKPGGLICTLRTTGQQWDAPNGWAPLHWMAVVGLENYGHRELASEIVERWTKLNSDVFKRTGKLMEKYNVVDTELEAGGGEYPGQDGFGWTNGVLLALKRFQATGLKAERLKRKANY
jgi:alpha,alpha-trehalase